jgi:hypothetical protein
MKKDEDIEHGKKGIFPWQREGTDVDSNNWKEDLEKTTYANELLSATEKDITNGVHHIPLSHWLQKNEKLSSDLFTRQCQRELWNEVFMYLEYTPDSHALVTGNPGIGKSRSMTYLLRMLLQNGKTVIYQARKDERYYAFIPPEGHKEGSEYKVWSCDSNGFKTSDCVVLQNGYNYCLIDPDTPDRIVGISAHIVLSASPNRAHFKEFLKLANTIPWCMPIWKKEELKALQPYLEIEKDLKLTDKDFEARYFDFGGRIRFMYASKEKYEVYWITLNDSVQKLGLSQLTNALADEFIEMSQSDEVTPSMLFVYNVLGVQSTFSSINYKYRQVRGNIKVSIASERVRQLLSIKYWKDIMDVLNPKSVLYSGNDLANGRLFELVSRVYLEFDVELEARNDSKSIDHMLKLPQGKRRDFGGTWEEYLLECSKLPMSSSTTSGPRDIVVPKAINQPVVDMMDAVDRGYQFVVGKKHGVNLKRLQTMVQILKLTPQNPLKLYFVIPESRVEEFGWVYEKQSEIDKKSIESLKKCVEVYAIAIPKDPNLKVQDVIEGLQTK